MFGAVPQGSLNEFAAAPADYLDFVTKTQQRLRAIQDWEILWSPAVTQKFSSYTPNGKAVGKKKKKKKTKTKTKKN